MGKRNYPCTDVKLVVGGSVISSGLITFNKEFVVYAPWMNVEYGTGLKLRIKTAKENHLSIDPKAAQKQQTQKVKALIEMVREKSSMFNTLLRINYENYPESLKNAYDILGFTNHYADVQEKEQEPTYEFLNKFSKGTLSLKGEMIKMGIPEVHIDELSILAVKFSIAEEEQEILKLDSCATTDQGVNEFNAIYKELMKICELGKKIFADNKPIRDRFTFSKVIENMSNSPKPKIEEEA